MYTTIGCKKVINLKYKTRYCKVIEQWEHNVGYHESWKLQRDQKAI